MPDKFAVGQEVRVYRGHRRGRFGVTYLGEPEIVTKVARKLVTVTGGYGKDQKFNMDDGVESRGGNAIGSPDIVRTLADVAERCHRERLIANLEAHGLELYRRANDVPTRKILAAVEAMDAAS